MTTLAEFLEEVHAAGKPVQPDMLAYRMDRTSPNLDMRVRAGLGTCNCCDYFTFSNGTVVLIEETRLGAQIQDILKKLAHLQDDDRKRHLLRSLKHENRLKVYGSLLVLCRLARKLADKAEAAAVSGITNFWLVYSDDMDRDTRVVDRIRDELMRDLRGVLTRKVVGDVCIVPASELGRRLPSQPPHPSPI